MHLALVRSCESSNLECEASSRTCGLRGGAALAAQGRAIREVVYKRYNKASTNVIYYNNDKMSDTEYAEA